MSNGINMVTRSRSWILLLLIGLTSTRDLGAQGRPATADPGSTVPLHAGVTDARGALERLTSATGRRTAEQTVRMYDDILVRIGAVKELALIVRQFHPDAAMRTAAETLAQAAAGLETELSLNPAAYGALAGAKPAGAPTDIARYLKLELGDYRREGVDQNAATRARINDLRRRMLLESQNVAYPAHLAVLQRMVEARAELAHTLGYQDWAGFDLSSRMAATPRNAAAFIDCIVAASTDKANADYQLILNRKKQDQPGATVVNAWERRYYTELVRQSSYNFDSQAMRPYFSYQRVRAGVFAVSGRLFGLEFRAAPVRSTGNTADRAARCRRS